MRLHHIVGVPTDDGALKRLPLARAAAAIVSADVDTESVDTQITDSEVIISSRMLMEIYSAHAAKAFRRTRLRHPPLALICEFNDVLTKRLLELQPGLVQPQGEYDDEDDEGINEEGAAAETATSSLDSLPWVEVLPFHRQCLETSALSVSAHSHASWRMMRRLLDARGGVDVRSYRVSSVTELDANGGATTFSFYDLADRMSAKATGRGVLIGWRRGDDEPCINPLSKDEQLEWSATDRLIVVVPQQRVQRGRRETTVLPRTAKAQAADVRAAQDQGPVATSAT